MNKKELEENLNYKNLNDYDNIDELLESIDEKSENDNIIDEKSENDNIIDDLME